MKLLSPAISRLARIRHWRIAQWANDPIASQREVLQDLITHGQYTEFGRKYGFNQLFNIRKIKEAVPIHEYDDLKPYIDRIMAGGEKRILNKPISWVAKKKGSNNQK